MLVRLAGVAVLPLLPAGRWRSGRMRIPGANGHHVLNRSAAMIWLGMKRGMTTDAVAAALAATYELSPESAREEVRRFARTLSEAGALDDHPTTEAAGARAPGAGAEATAPASLRSSDPGDGAVRAARPDRVRM